MKPHKHRKGNLKRITAALAGAAIMSSMVLPGLPPAVVHASANKNKAEATQQVKQEKKSVQDKETKAPRHYEDVLEVTATAYAPGPHDNDQWGSKTHLGTEVRPGVIAVDPNIIPLGSKVYIQYPDGQGTYAVAEDTGGAIKGNRIDIAKWSVDEAKDFGMKNVKVYIIDKNADQSNT